MRNTPKYQTIVASIREVGVIEPLAVHPETDSYILLDGHLRLEALKELGAVEAVCLVATEDEGFDSITDGSTGLARCRNIG